MTDRSDFRAFGVLAGGGEMGALARLVDWARTPVGAVETWPQSLRTSVSILLESRFPMLICWGREFVQFYNDPFRPILGVRKHPALGKGTRDTFAEAWHIIGPLFEQVMQGTAVGFEDMLVPLDRAGFLEECYFSYSYSPIRDESGGVGGILVTCTETTARVVAERRLRMLRELASQAAQAQAEDRAWAGAAEVVSTSPADVPFALLYTLDASGVDARLAGATASPIGAAPVLRKGDPDAPWPLFAAASAAAPILVRDVEARFGPRPGPAWPEPVQAAMVLAITRPGLPQPYGFLVAGLSPRLPLDDKYRDFLALLGDQIATAVANARAYDEERRRTEALLEIDRQKTAFFGNVSHEFRTPLTLMLAPVEAALGRSPKILEGGDLELVYRNATRLLRLVNTLLDFSRIEAGRATTLFEETDLAALTRDLASTFTSLMGSAGLRFEIDCPPLGRLVSVDRGMWEKVVLNLLSNAFKFTLHGSVRVELRDAGASVRLCVRDTGAGIPAADLPLIFDRFHRVAATPSRTFEGSGIGLALVRELVRIHGGEVAVDSVEGQGSTFVVTIPIRREARPPAPARAALPAASAAAAVAGPYVEEARRWDGAPASFPRLTPEPGAGQDAGQEIDLTARLLVVDDNADMRQYLARLLGRYWRLDLAANGREALQMATERRPDLILSDVMMPEVDGLELLRLLRGDSRTRLIPVILLSARSGEESRIEGLTAGADDYIVKPFSAKELIARVRTHLELSRLRHETVAQHDRLVTLINMAPAAIAVVRGPDHVFELANERYLQIVGSRPILGKPGREALPELTGQGVWDLFDGVYRSGEAHVAHEFRVALNRLGSGTLDEGFFNFVLQPLKDVRGATEGILIHAVEVTHQVRARGEIDEARRAAEAANRAKDEFLAMLGHELRNPLAPILTALQLMTLRGDRGAEREREIIERQVRHVVRLVDDLLDVSRITRGKVELKRERIEVGAVVARAVEMVRALLEEKRHALDLEIPPSGLAVDADQTRLQQVVFNLLHNAAKYTEPGGRITVQGARRNGTVELRVRDTGVGLAPEMLPLVFDLFVQDRQALDRAQGGLGLGLAIVRNLVELHGGRVAASSGGPGQGSEFVVTLPAARQDAGPRTAEQVADRPHGPTGFRARILIVDDNPDAGALLSDALGLAGFDVRTAADAASALQLAEDFDPDVAILDLGLPIMDGYELAACLRRRAHPPALIAVTGYGATADDERTRTTGFDAHLVKPIDVADLLDRLDRLSEEPAPGR